MRVHKMDARHFNGGRSSPRLFIRASLVYLTLIAILGILITWGSGVEKITRQVVMALSSYLPHPLI